MMGRRMGYSQGKLAVTPREKRLAAQYGDKKRITRGDVITAAKKKSGKRMQASVGGGADTGTIGELKSKLGVLSNKVKRDIKRIDKRLNKRAKKMGGGVMRPMYRKGGGVCLRGMNREAVGKNS